MKIATEYTLTLILGGLLICMSFWVLFGVCVYIHFPLLTHKKIASTTYDTYTYVCTYVHVAIKKATTSIFKKVRHPQTSIRLQTSIGTYVHVCT